MIARQPREENPAFLAWVRLQPCTICARPGPNDPAHLRSAALQYGKRATGMQEKPDDKWVLPLCRTHHEAQHRENELRWWARMGFLDPFALAHSLYANCPVPTRPTVRRPKLVKPRRPPAERKEIYSRSEWPQGRKIQSRPMRVKERTE